MQAFPGAHTRYLRYLLPGEAFFKEQMNKITLIGNLGQDPEIKSSSNGEYMTFSIAVKMKKDDTQWFRCNVWSDRMESLQRFKQWLKKGSMICVDGRLEKPSIYQGKNGDTVNMSVSVTDLNFVPGKKEDDARSVHTHVDTGSIQQGQGQSEFVEDPDLPF